MLKEFVRSLENDKAPLLGPNIWCLKKIGLILPKNKLGKVIFIIIHEIVAVFVLTQYMELYVIRSNLDLVLTNLKISMLSIVCVVKVNTFVFWQSKWDDVINYINAADKFERDTRNDVKGQILDSYTKYCRNVTYSYWILVVLTFLTTVLTPLVFISQQSFREDLKNQTVQFPHIFSSWMPFDKNHNPGIWITIIWHTILCAYGASTMAAYDTVIMVIMVFFGGKLELLRERCKQMLGSDGMAISDEKAFQITKELHTVFVLLTKHYRLFNSVLSPVMFLYVVMCSLMLCASAFQLSSARNTTEKILMAEYLVFGIAQLFVFCWHSNDVLVKSNNVMFGPYESQWWMAGGLQRKCVFILGGQLSARHIFTAGPFTELTLSTFLGILKGAYSYYTLLRK